MVKEIKNRISDDKIDLLERKLVEKFPVINCPLTHRFTPGLYIREIFMPAGAIVTSKIHRTEHPFFIMKGRVSVFSDTDGEQILEAPYTGITHPNTRRVIIVHEDCIWITTHCITEGETLSDIEKRIIEPHENTLLTELMESESFLIE